ncbi:plastocyanin/azurin family copper-binding protein [Aurantiacibacter sp. MUD61]|uniref:plastocyanin/azurin family copper-binding protein n=1 Tax=Aurantiacibacter sp. MUD61 TaxID=3009083 RepID=UPI0022F07682|nr:plastocyanin/azurin family copper-binding protein [Aurantiacibacter sp. MUD61]
MKRLNVLALAAACCGLTACGIPQNITPQIAAPSTDFANAPRVDVEIDSFSFEPRTLRLAAGEPVVLVLTNVSDGRHNFSAPGFFAASRIAQYDASVITDGEVEVAPGDSVELRLIPAMGGYDVDCTHFGHSLAGMTGSIVVR